MADNGESYVDEKGRVRWCANDDIGARLKALGVFLVVGGYEESHATRYPKLAHAISRYPESVARLHREGRLGDIPGVGETIAEIIGELIDTGTCTKMEEWAQHTPKSVLELTAIPGMGAKMVRTLYQEHGIYSLESLRVALESDRLTGIRGLGKKTLATLRSAVRQAPDAPLD